MRQLRPILIVLLLGATVTQRLQGLLLGLTVLAVAEVIGAVLRLQGPERARRRPVWDWLRRLPFPWRRRRRTSAASFSAYDRIVADIGWARFSRRDFDVGLRERLLAVASVRLADGHGVDLAANPEAARRLLGEEAWDLLGPGRPASTDRTAPGVDLRTLDQLVGTLESLRPEASAESRTEARPEARPEQDPATGQGDRPERSTRP
ncbi:hypothetical protein SAMN05421678_112179 [Actinopolymorpha cephalotaxi]|uniref:Uncharacterized protein n=1 Tax=Actinopolymorpha cephalotaxi TaxID=504797 RepID=A0A1I2XG70_9ACTN|nr:hypothetical protein [Actinopolymorpha cephalotaxi]NYH86244.1 hypothetical protein [Actinopolymorpha cephalotaxi]SFH12498.1 hypothetical protein SAMN05421678_112179 [Actinopolymorpha cephalotaxi]